MSKDTSWVDSFPFSSYLNSNYIPFDEEAAQIKAFLTEPSKRLGEMKAEMDRLQAELNLIQAKYNNLHHHFTSFASLITLPRRLPYDILEEIFYQTLPTDRNAALSNNSAPLIFTRICRRWRQVAFSTPRLWSTIHVHLIPKPLNPWMDPTAPLPQQWDKSRAAAVWEWLKRAGDLPLHISFVVDKNQLASPELVDLYLKSIIPFSSRWKSLVLEGPANIFSRISTLEVADLGSLELFIFDVDRPLEYDANRFPTSGQEFTSTWSKCGLLTSSSLRKLSIRRAAITNPTALSVDWGQLTHLEIGAFSGIWRSLMVMPMSVASQLLQVSSRLVVCRIKIASWADAPPIHFMQLPLLRSLSIQTEGNILPFTEKLEVPALQQIGLYIIENTVTEDIVDYNCLAPLFQSDQTIQKLEIDTRYLDHGSFLEILRKCPNLISLTVKRYPEPNANPRRGDIPPVRIDDEFLTSMSANNGACCPHLEEFICDYIADFSATGMIEFIKRKQQGDIPKLAKLKKVAIPPYSKGDSLEEMHMLSGELQPHISQGLTFQIFELDKRAGFHTFADGVDYGYSTAQYAESWGL